MGESKHTPGPWIIKYSGNGYPYQLDAPNGSRGPGGIRSVTRWGAFSFPSSPEALANARLIAAAPDLANAAVDILDYMGMDAWLDSPGGDLEVWGVRKKDLRALRSAMAKAEPR